MGSGSFRSASRPAGKTLKPHSAGRENHSGAQFVFDGLQEQNRGLFAQLEQPYQTPYLMSLQTHAVPDMYTGTLLLSGALQHLDYFIHYNSRHLILALQGQSFLGATAEE